MTLCSVKTSPDLVDKVSLKWFPRPRGDDMGRPLLYVRRWPPTDWRTLCGKPRLTATNWPKAPSLSAHSLCSLRSADRKFAVSLSLKSGISLTTNASASETSWLGRLGGQPRHFPANEITVHALVAN